MDRSEAPKRKSESRSKSKLKKDFLTIGIGASAGGIKALKEFFAKMPADNGMAFVVVLHLSQTHESNLAGILQRETEMPVVQVKEATRVEPNHVYVVPPAKGLEMVDGIVRLTDKARPRGQRIIIDRFFRTLAEAYCESAIGIVLSGAGEDGTVGIKKIKEYNGFVIAQKPEDAEFDQMPRSAIATGVIDCVLPVAEMPEKLLSLRKSTAALNLTEDDGQFVRELKGAEALREILAILRVRIGHDFSNYKQPTLLRRIARHLQIHELPDLAAYAKFLRENQEEAEFLLKNLLINVTTFFRDKHAFETLESDVIPRLFAGKTAEDQIRVWSAACATGEEAYSLAMLLYEYAEKVGDAPKVQIFASDVDDEAIGLARQGLYPEGIANDVSPDRLKRFFVREGSGYRVKKELRETILFTPHNILRDPPFSRLDFVACRNLLIYLNRDTQERLMQIFHFALRPDGFLFLGSSETADTLPLLFSSFDKKRRIYFRRPANMATHPPFHLPDRDKWQATPGQVAPRTGAKGISFEELHYRLLEKFASPSVLVNEDYEIVHLSENAGRFLKFVGGEPTNSLLKVVNPDLSGDLRTALFTAKQDRNRAEVRNIAADIEGKPRFVSLTVYAVEAPNATGDFMLVVFNETDAPDYSIQEIESLAQKAQGEGGAAVGALDTLARHLEEELRRTKDRLRVTVEQYETSVEELKASNEELQATNEELRLATEELETSKEELQSVNEELTTVNAELKEKIDELSVANSDLQNLIYSTDIAVIFLDRNLQIKRFTQQAQEIFNIINSDVGRPIRHLTHRLAYKELTADAEQVLRKLQPIEREVAGDNGKYYIARVLPYRTLDERINGVVLTFVDISDRKRAEDALRLVQENMAVALEAAEMGVWDVDLKTRRTRTNLRHNNIFGFDKPIETWSPEIFRSFVLPEYQAETDKSFERAMQTGVFDLQVPIRLNGGVRWIYERGRVFYDEEKKPFRMTGVTLDITERKDSEQALRELAENYRSELEKQVRDRTAELNESRNLLQATMDSSMEMIQVFSAVRDESGEIVDFRWILNNPASEKIYGDVIGKSLLQNNPGVVEEGIFDTFKRVVETGESDQSERHYVHEQFNGWFYQSIVKLDDGVATTTTDITELKKAEREAETTKERLQAMLDSSLYQVQAFEAVRDEKGKIVDFKWAFTNKAWNDRYGEMVGKSLLRENPGVVESGLFEKFVEVTETGAQIDHEQFYNHEQFENAWFHQTLVKMGDGFVMNAEDITEKKKAQAEILRLKDQIAQSAEEALRFQCLLLNTVEQSVIATDLEGKITYWNSFAEKLFGWTAEEAVGRGIVELNTPEIELEHAAEIMSRLQRGENWSGEFTLRRRDGAQFLAHVSNMPITDERGNLIGVVGVASDITDRQRIEEALRRNQEMFSALVQNAPFGIYMIDAEFRLRAVNKGAQAVFSGIEPLIGRDFAELLRIVWKEPFATEAIEKFRHTLETGESYYSPTIVEERGNIEKIESYDWQLHRIVLPDGSYNVVCYYYDLSEQKRMEKSLRESEEHLRLLVESVEDYAIIALTPDGRIISWNPGAEEIFGFTEDEILGESAEIIFTPEDRAAGAPEDELKTAIETGRAADERWHIRKDGSRFFASGVLTILGENAENGFVKILRDLTERKQFEDTLKEADRRKDEFLATLAHELRNPLAPIRTALEIMRRGEDKSKGQNARDIIERQTNQLVHLVDDLLDISRITQGKIKLRTERVDIAEPINSAIETVQPFVELQRHKLDVRLPDKAVFVEADRTRLTQIVLNLLHNSAKYTEPGGHILLIAAREGKEAVIRVRDNGIGIQFEMLPAIFDMFAQTALGERRGQGGLGIGLSLVKKLVEMHGGKVEALSEGEGKGSEFIVRLPLAAEQKPAAKKKKTAAKKAAAKPQTRKILVVDDNADAANMLEVFLSMENHAVETAFNGRDALDKAAGFKPETAILDIGLPDMNGYELAKRLRAEFPEICLIALSGWGQDEDRRRSKEAGFNHHLVKPVDVDELKKFLCP